MKWFSKQSAIALALSNGRNLTPEGPWIAVGALGPFLLRRDFAMSHIIWEVTSQLSIFISHRSCTFFRVIRLIRFVTQLTDVLHAGCLVSWNIFRSLCLSFTNRSKAWRSLFMSQSVIWLVDRLYAEAIGTVSFGVGAVSVMLWLLSLRTSLKPFSWVAADFGVLLRLTCWGVRLQHGF
jgi:hypothetical protein